MASGRPLSSEKADGEALRHWLFRGAMGCRTGITKRGSNEPGSRKGLQVEGHSIRELRRNGSRTFRGAGGMEEEDRASRAVTTLKERMRLRPSASCTCHPGSKNGSDSCGPLFRTRNHGISGRLQSHLSQFVSSGAAILPRGSFSMSGDIFDHRKVWGGWWHWCQWVKTTGAAERPTGAKTGPPHPHSKNANGAQFDKPASRLALLRNSLPSERWQACP